MSHPDTSVYTFDDDTTYSILTCRLREEEEDDDGRSNHSELGVNRGLPILGTGICHCFESDVTHQITKSKPAGTVSLIPTALFGKHSQTVCDDEKTTDLSWGVLVDVLSSQ